MTNTKNNNQIWLSPDTNWFKIHKPWLGRAIRRNITKVEWLKIINSIARNQKLETKIQKKNWIIQWWNSYWNDPCPPKDKNT